ncbi:MAG TPA: type VI secretion system tube protein Hcp [Candidatus Udaeobacter sp.]|jgi:type VI secretion system secreted protein Hcp
MGLDIFANIAGIQGESLDATHKGEIEVLSCSWGVTNPVSAVPASAVGRATFQHLTFVHKIDKASPLLMQACAESRRIQQATITYRNAQQQDYLIVKLNDVGITGITAAGASGQAASETVSLVFATIALQYMPQKADGSLDAVVSFQYNLVAKT